jgi:hypothetical protein
MKLFPRFMRRKRNLRRILAGAFLFIAFVEAGSHAYVDYHRAADATTPNGCRVTENRTTTVDCPDKRKQRSQERNMIDEMTIHAVILNRMSVPTTGRLYDTAVISGSIAGALSGVQDSPFHPPELA